MGGTIEEVKTVRTQVKHLAPEGTPFQEMIGVYEVVLGGGQAVHEKAERKGALLEKLQKGDRVNLEEFVLGPDKCLYAKLDRGGWFKLRSAPEHFGRSGLKFALRDLNILPIQVS